jgi:hypothetical protein
LLVAVIQQKEDIFDEGIECVNVRHAETLAEKVDGSTLS